MTTIAGKKDIDKISEFSKLDITYLDNFFNSDKNFICLNINDNNIDGLFICSNDNDTVCIEDIIIEKEYNKTFKELLKHLIFNSKGDIQINDLSLMDTLKEYDFEINPKDSNIMIRKFKTFTPTNIKIVNYFDLDNDFKNKVLDQINEAFWVGAKHLYERINKNEQLGKLFIMYDEALDHIISFGTFVDFDEIDASNLKPWIGSIYTFRPYRGNKYSQKLINYILDIAKSEGYDKVYLSSDNKGMYEKFGFDLYAIMKTVKGSDTQVFVYDLNKEDLWIK